MAPKFRGNSDDWLDNEGSLTRSKQAKPKKKSPAPSTPLTAEQTNAVILEVFPNQCRARLDEDRAVLLCSYRRASIFGTLKNEIRERAPVAVGDRVLVSRSGSKAGTESGIVEKVSTRRNSIYRLAPGQEGKTICHVLASNIDLVIIVASADRPKFSPGLVDRFLVGAEVERVPSLICINKIDMVTNGK